MNKILIGIPMAMMILYADSTFFSNGQFTITEIVLDADKTVDVNSGNRNSSDTDSNTIVSNNILGFTIKSTGAKRSFTMTNASIITSMSFHNQKHISLQNVSFNLSFHPTFAVFSNSSSINVDENSSFISNSTSIKSVVFEDEGSLINKGNTSLTATTFENRGNISSEGKTSSLLITLKADGKKTFKNSVGTLEISEGTAEIKSIKKETTEELASFLNFSLHHKVSDDMPGVVETRGDSLIIVGDGGTLKITDMKVFNGGMLESTSTAGSTIKDFGHGIIKVKGGSTLSINESLDSEGSGFRSPTTKVPGVVFGDELKKRSEIHIIENSKLEVGKTFTNHAGSDLYVQGLITAQKFESLSDSKIIFSGIKNGSLKYGKIKAAEIKTQNANFVFKTNNLSEGDHVILESTSSDANKLEVPNSITGNVKLVGDDGNPSIFFTGQIIKTGNSLLLKVKQNKKIILKNEDGKTNHKESEIVSEFMGIDPKIKSLGTNELKNIVKQVSNGVQHFAEILDANRELSNNILDKTINSRLSNFKFQGANYSLQQYTFLKTADANKTSIHAIKAKSFSVYASIIGGYAKFDGGNGYGIGLSVGVDSSISDILFGGVYGSYLHGNVKSDKYNNNNSNIQTGIYGRLGKNIELDFKLGYNLSINNAENSVKIVDNHENNFKYKTHSFVGLVGIGYRFDIHNSSLKPYVNLNFSSDLYSFNDSLVKYKFNNDIFVNSTLGLEYNVKINNLYIFATPTIDLAFFRKNKEVDAALRNTSVKIKFSKEHFGGITTGILMPMSKNLHIYSNASFKVSNKKTMLFNIEASIKYLF